MRPERNSLRLLQTTQSKAKMYEYNIPDENHIQLYKDPAELLRLTIAIIGDTAAQINNIQGSIRSEITSTIDKQNILIFVAHFFDSYLNTRLVQHSETKQYLLLLGASAYYLCDLPGSANVLAKTITEDLADLGCDGIENLLLWILKGDLSEDYGGSEGDLSLLIENCYACFKSYYLQGNNHVELLNNVEQLRKNIYCAGSPRQLLFVDILLAIVKKKVENASWTVLPVYSGLPIESWRGALRKSSFIKEFWPAQHYIGKNQVLRGESAVIQMPTSAGKTKAVELILRSGFLSGRTSLAIIVAPFRALCHEIKDSLIQAFQNETVHIDELSDTFQMDFNIAELFGLDVAELLGMPPLNKRIVVVTPEKLLYVLRHAPDSASKVGLIIFDEGHQFDNGTRGITYELLVTSLKLLFPENIQKVLISAVISNGCSVANWLNNNNNVITGSNLNTSFKTVGFVSWLDNLGRIVYRTENIDEDVYYVPRVIEAYQLQLRKRERKKRVFPEKSNGGSIALYLGFRLIPNGSIAIFCGKKTKAASLCQEFIDAVERGLTFTCPSDFSAPAEINKLKSLLEAHFGSEADISKCATYGIFAHHANVPHGVRLAIEHAMRENLIKFVICTSTLAQGVNLPIRYLIVADVDQGKEKIKTRDFQNLIGRAGRSGMHTEGSILFANNNIYDQRNSNTWEKKWRWEQTKKLLNPENSEPCISNLLEIFTPIKNDKGEPIQSLSYTDFVQGYLNNSAHFIDQLIKYYDDNELVKVEHLKRQLFFKTNLISVVESFLLFHCSDNAEDLSENRVIKLAQATLAYHLADTDTVKQNICDLFRLIAENISSKLPEPNQRRVYGKTLLSVNDTNLIKEWLTTHISTLLSAKTSNELLNSIWSLLSQYVSNKNFNKFTDPDSRLTLAQFWIDGNSFIFTHQYIMSSGIKKIWGKGSTNFKLEDIVDIFENGLSYDGTLFINALIVLIEDLAQEKTEKLLELLKLLQKRMRYGLPSQNAIVVYELGFSDRFIAMDLANSLGNQNINSMGVKNMITQRSSSIEQKIMSYPSYFIEVAINISN